MIDFVHIHQHSQYSKFDGVSSVEDIVKTAKAFKMSAVGLTDHGTFAGAINFLKTCRKYGVKPILGMEAYLCANHKAKTKAEQPTGRKGNRHIVLIAKNYEGYQNLCTLAQIASVEGFYYDPRIDIELLQKYSKGVISTSACLSHPINWHLSNGRYEQAKEVASIFKDIYGEDFYLEMMYHGIETQARILPDIQKLSTELNIKTIVTNDCHYLKQADAEFHEVMMCINSGRALKDPKRLSFPYKEFYFKSQQEIYKIFGHVYQSMKNTLEIAEKCDYSEITFGKMRLPKFDIPEQFAVPQDYLEHLAWQGLKKLGLENSKSHVERLKTELSDLRLVWETKKYDFASYFLIVQDIMDFAREKKISANIRGSGYGSFLLKTLGIIDSNIDPVKDGLLWSRFLGFDEVVTVYDTDFGL